MIRIKIKDNLNLRAYQLFFSDLSPLMRQWRDARSDIFERQFKGELDPEDKPLRNLTQRYQAWKDKYYPGRVKRELSGRTKGSHSLVPGRNNLTEEINVNAVLLQEDLDLPLLPDDWTDPTARTLLNLSEMYLTKNF